MLPNLNKYLPTVELAPHEIPTDSCLDCQFYSWSQRIITIIIEFK